MPFTQISPGWIVAKAELGLASESAKQSKMDLLRSHDFLQVVESALMGRTYYWFFTILMIVTFVLFIPFAICFTNRRPIYTSRNPKAPSRSSPLVQGKAAKA